MLRLNTDAELVILEGILKRALVPGPEMVERSRCKLWPNRKLKMTRPGTRKVSGHGHAEDAINHISRM